MSDDLQIKKNPQFSNDFLQLNSQLSVLSAKQVGTKMSNHSSYNPFNLFCNSFSFFIFTNTPITAYKNAILANTTTRLSLFGLIPYNQVPPEIAKYTISFLFTILAFLSNKSILSFNSIDYYSIKRN